MRFRKIAAALLTLALGFCLCQPAAFAATAADQHTQLQELPVSIQSTGETPLPKETLTVELEAVDNAPLPQVTTLEITDGETGEALVGARNLSLTFDLNTGRLFWAPTARPAALAPSTTPSPAITFTPCASAPVSTPAAPTMKPCTICAFPWCGTMTSWWPGWPCTHRPT